MQEAYSVIVQSLGRMRKIKTIKEGKSKCLKWVMVTTCEWIPRWLFWLQIPSDFKDGGSSSSSQISLSSFPLVKPCWALAVYVFPLDLQHSEARWKWVLDDFTACLVSFCNNLLSRGLATEWLKERWKPLRLEETVKPVESSIILLGSKRGQSEGELCCIASPIKDLSCCICIL